MNYKCYKTRIRTPICVVLFFFVGQRLLNYITILPKICNLQLCEYIYLQKQMQKL